MMLLLYLLILQIHYDAALYPDAAGLVINESVTIDIDHDFKIKEHRDSKIYIFGTRGREKYADAFQKYNSRYETLEIIKAQTVFGDGMVLKPERKAISDLSTVQAYLAPAYKDMRTRTVSYSGVGPDVVLEYESMKSGKYQPDNRMVFGRVPFKKKDPVLHKELVLKIPKDADIKYLAYGNILTQRNDEGDFIVYRWSLDSIPRIKQEPSTIPINEFVPRVAFSNFQDWKQVGEWLGKKCRDAVVVSDEMKKYAADLATKIDSSVIYNIYRHVATDWRDIPLSLQDVGYTPLSTAEIYKYRYGNMVDKCALLIALLKAAGIEAFPAFVSFSEVRKSLPMPEYFGIMLVAVPDNGDYIFLDPRFDYAENPFYDISGILSSLSLCFPSSSYHPTFLPSYYSIFLPSYLPTFLLFSPTYVPASLLPDALGRPVFVVKPDTFVFTTTPDFGSGAIADVKMDIKIAEDGTISGTVYSKLYGLSATIARQYLRHKKGKDLQLALENMLGSLKAGTRLENSDIRGMDDPLSPVEITIGFEAPDYLVKQGTSLRFSIPAPNFSFFSIGSFFSTTSREYPLTVYNRRTLQFILNITWPEDLKLTFHPENIAAGKDNLALAVNSYEPRENSILISKRFGFEKSEYAPDEYPELLSVYESYESINQQFLIFTNLAHSH